MKKTFRHKAVMLMIGLVVLSCMNTTNIPVPDAFGTLKQTKLLQGDEAAEFINQLHGLPISPTNSVVAEYGEQNKTILYISRFESKEVAREYIKNMIHKMMRSRTMPFSPPVPLKPYRKRIYFTVGMRQLHYIYYSGPYLLWVTTNQDFGKEVAPVLFELYPYSPAQFDKVTK